MKHSLLAYLPLTALSFAAPASADPAADFYHGKTLTMVIATSPGGDYDSPNVVNSWYTTGIKTIQDVMERELVVGAPGTNTASVISRIGC